MSSSCKTVYMYHIYCRLKLVMHSHFKPMSLDFIFFQSGRDWNQVVGGIILSGRNISGTLVHDSDHVSLAAPGFSCLK